MKCYRERKEKKSLGKYWVLVGDYFNNVLKEKKAWQKKIKIELWVLFVIRAIPNYINMFIYICSYSHRHISVKIKQRNAWM